LSISESQDVQRAEARLFVNTKA